MIAGNISLIIDEYFTILQYTSKHAITSADIPNDRVFPFLEQQEVPLLRVPTDQGTDFNEHPEHHEYELYLKIEDIDQSKTKSVIFMAMAFANAFIGRSRISFMRSNADATFADSSKLSNQKMLDEVRSAT